MKKNNLTIRAAKKVASIKVRLTGPDVFDITEGENDEILQTSLKEDELRKVLITTGLNEKQIDELVNEAKKSGVSVPALVYVPRTYKPTACLSKEAFNSLISSLKENDIVIKSGNIQGKVDNISRDYVVIKWADQDKRSWYTIKDKIDFWKQACDTCEEHNPEKKAEELKVGDKVSVNLATGEEFGEITEVQPNQVGISFYDIEKYPNIEFFDKDLVIKQASKKEADEPAKVETKPEEVKLPETTLKPYQKKPPKFEPGEVTLPTKEMDEVWTKVKESQSRLEALKRTIDEASAKFEEEKQRVEKEGGKILYEQQMRDSINHLASMIEQAGTTTISVGDKLLALKKETKEVKIVPDTKWKLEKVLEKFPDAVAYLEKAVAGATRLGDPKEIRELVMWPNKISAEDTREGFLDILKGVYNDLKAFMFGVKGINQVITEVGEEQGELQPALASLRKRSYYIYSPERTPNMTLNEAKKRATKYISEILSEGAILGYKEEKENYDKLSVEYLKKLSDAKTPEDIEDIVDMFTSDAESIASKYVKHADLNKKSEEDLKKEAKITSKTIVTTEWTDKNGKHHVKSKEIFNDETLNKKSAEDLKVGDRVKHSIYGEGTVREVGGPDQAIFVKYDKQSDRGIFSTADDLIKIDKKESVMGVSETVVEAVEIKSLSDIKYDWDSSLDHLESSYDAVEDLFPKLVKPEEKELASNMLTEISALIKQKERDRELETEGKEHVTAK